MITKHIKVDGIDGRTYLLGIQMLELDDLTTIYAESLGMWYYDLKELMDMQLGMVWSRECPVCHKNLATWDAHHALITKGDLPKKYRPLIDAQVNIMPLHNHCHLQSPPTREDAWEWLTDRYGLDLVSEWYYDIIGPVFKSGHPPRRF